MPKIVIAGCFYEFDRKAQQREVGHEIHYSSAVARVRDGRDVYTLRRSDAFRLARACYPMLPAEEPPHSFGYFRHFHAGGLHQDQDRFAGRGGPGHIFFRFRGHGEEEQ